jgi:hypothetical protein
MKRLRGWLMLAFATSLTPLLSDARADEGMWAFNNLPKEQLKEAYGFEPSDEWIRHLQLSAVRFNSGGSGSFVSADGLVMTNHHVGADTLQKISTPEHDHYRTGFHAKTRAEEVKAPDLELNVVVAIRDVTEQVTSKVTQGMSDADAEAARRKAIAEIEKAATDANKLRNDVVKLYQGGQYHLYTYKVYTDVRMVFAPEFDIAFFGGDPDNFEYPRYCLDVCFFRAYEDGKPAKVEHYLRWSPDGTKEGDLVFVAGNPGRTSRLNTLAHLEYLRDVGFPLQLDFLADKEAFLQEYSKRGPEQARQAKEYLFGIQNALKARRGGLGGLRDAGFMARKKEAEQALRRRIAANPEAQKAYGSAWDRIAGAEKRAAEVIKPYNLLERGLGFDTELFSIARVLVRLAQEDPKPDADRLREYQQSGRRSLELMLYSAAPIYPEFEAAKLAASLAYWKKALPDDSILARVLQGRSPEQAAADLVKRTKLADGAERKRLAEGGMKAIEASDDPMIKLALAIDADARKYRKIREDEVEGVEASNYALLSKANFEAYGDSVYPDATFTLRLAFGTVKGYEQDGRAVAAFTTVGGAFEHAKAHGDKPPYVLPETWVEAKGAGRLELETPLNFVCTADIIGGNSGSPVVDRAGSVVGLIFDGNIQSLVLDFGYDDTQARAVSVDSRGIVEALRGVYRAEGLLEELGVGAK